MCMISGKPDQIARQLQNMQFQVGIYHEKLNWPTENSYNDGGLLSSVLLFQMIFTFKRCIETEAYLRRRRALFILFSIFLLLFRIGPFKNYPKFLLRTLRLIMFLCECCKMLICKSRKCMKYVIEVVEFPHAIAIMPFYGRFWVSFRNHQQ